MSLQTQKKLIRKGIDPVVVAKLDAAGILYPNQIKDSSKGKLETAKLDSKEIDAVRLVFPERKK
jgi:hypothetical protein